VINTAAMHHVEKCDQEPTAAYVGNTIGARNLAAVTRNSDVILSHVGTDYAFDGDPIINTDVRI
jgi:dTDP-4-dehydrorhamnose reductase